MRDYFVYILSSKSRRIYTGVTNDLERRVFEHRHQSKGFTSKYRVFRLVFYEHHRNPYAAISREKEIKGLSRERKMRLVSENNPAWDDLAQHWF